MTALRCSEETRPASRSSCKKPQGARVWGLRSSGMRGKPLRTLRKHGVAFEEAASAFGDSLSLTIPDPDHSAQEERCVLLGMTARHRLVVVAHTEEADTIRLISARLATPAERRNYEEHQGQVPAPRSSTRV